MKILIVSEDIPYPNMGGLAKHALALARALIRAGHEVDILGGDQHPIEAAGDEGLFGGQFYGELTGHSAGWKETRLGMFIPLRRSMTAKRFARIIMRRAKDYDVIHYHGHLPNVGRYIPAGVNFIQTRHDHGGDCIKHTRFRNGEVCDTPDPRVCASCIAAHPNLLQQAVSTMAVVRLRKDTARAFRTHKTVFVSDMLKRNFTRTMGNEPWGVTIHNFIDRGKIEHARRTARKSENTGEIRLFFSGKIARAKGIEALLNELTPRMPANMSVTIAGDGADEARLRKQYANDSRIRFAGWCTPEQTLEMAASAHAILVPSIWEEPSGTTILEGIMLGKPVFALARGGTPELAAYAGDPKQLKLFPDMRSLAESLTSFRPDEAYPLPPIEPASSDRAAQKLIEIYRLPSGPVFA